MTETDVQIGTQFGPYLLKRLIGSGGMGTVYEAQDTVMDRVVALKLISGTYAQDPDYRRRLQREARIAGRLHDPHVVSIHSTGEIDGQLYVDMRLVDGTDLDTMLKQSGPLPPAKAVSVVRQVASALDAAHAAGVLHRDVKPGNILITADDFAYLVDFGIANAATEQKLTQVGDTLGTWTYMAPERFSGDETQVTARADTYSLACVLFEALTGSPPFTGDRATLVASHLTQPPPRASVRFGLPPVLDDVISRGMAKKPEERYVTSGEFAQAAEQAIGQLGSATAAFTLPISVPRTQAGPTTPPPAPANWAPAPAAPTAYGPPTGPVGPPTGPPPVQPWPQPAPTRRKGHWIAIAASVALVVALAAGVGIWKLTGNKPAGAKGPDISKLDVGRYGTQPRPLTGVTSKEEGVFLEAFRLAEGIADPYAVDPILDHIYGNPIGDTKTAATSIAGTGTPLVQPVLDKYGMIAGYLVEGLNMRLLDFSRKPDGDMLRVMMTSFPNDDSAARAAAEMDAVDFAVNPENKVTPIPGYPQAKAHYRPDSPSVAATVAIGRVVLSVGVRSDSKPVLDYLVQRIKRAIDLSKPLIAKLIPAEEVSLTSVPRDSDNMLSRTFVAGEQPKISAGFGSIGPIAAALCEDGQARKDGLYDQAGVDRCAFSADSQLLRARDEKAAQALLPKLVEADREEFIDHDVAPPVGLPDARCYELKQKIWADNANSRFQCAVSFGRYVAIVWSNEEKDAKQRAAAQYAILVNSA